MKVESTDDCMNRVPKLIIPLLLLHVKIVCAYMHMYTRICMRWYIAHTLSRLNLYRMVYIHG